MAQIALTRQGAVARLTIDHPERMNALTPEMLEDLEAALEEIEGDPALRVVILTGAGERAFASGGDISRFSDTQGSPERIREGSVRRERVFHRLGTFPKPVVAMIRGYCMGGGLALALQADLRFAAEGSTFGIPAARLGIVYGVGGVERLMQLVGPSRAKDILFSARRFDAAEAHRIGLVDRTLPPEELESAVGAYCDQLAENAPISVEASKVMVAQALLPKAARDTALIEALHRRSAESADLVEGRTAFMEKRRPVFRGA
ncbi:MAG: enoyl-CoA hydratase [Pseudooceanicola nanhaiensis]|jgi:enoyl-CoA hydratase/carnithine racemase|uniref:enoyl-CoA hydratase n=1 Tax=Pseudooceanicola nanhaiensis TaxID=375761 RepID=UPI00300BF529